MQRHYFFSLGEPGNRIFIVVDNSLNVCVVPDDDQDGKDDLDDFDNRELWLHADIQGDHNCGDHA